MKGREQCSLLDLQNLKSSISSLEEKFATEDSLARKVRCEHQEADRAHRHALRCKSEHDESIRCLRTRLQTVLAKLEKENPGSAIARTMGRGASPGCPTSCIPHMKGKVRKLPQRRGTDG